MLELTSFRGTLSLCGPELQTDHINRLCPTAQVNAPHITILAKHEVQKLESFQVLSVGNVKDVEYLTVSWPHAQLYRKKLGLEPKAFHVTLSKVDNHDISKDFTTTKGGYLVFLEIFQELPESAMDFILADLLTTIWQQDLCLEFLGKFPTSYKALIRVADHTHDRPHISTNAYARALCINPSLYDYASKKLRRLAPRAPCGPFQIEGTEQLPASMLFPWPREAKEVVRDIISEASVETRVHISYITEPNFPRFFSMPIPYRLAGMSTPRYEKDIDLLQKVGITKVVTLTEEEPLDPAWFRYKRISHLFIPVPNYKAPTKAEMDLIYRTFTEDKDGFWLIHCGGGKGRAGTILACLLAMQGSDDGTPKMDKTTVISLLRKIRPGSIETEQQETFVASWLSHRWKTAHMDVKIEEPYSTLTQDINHKSFPSGITSQNVKCIILVGLPGSGKSHVAEAIALRRPGTVVISQDESGSRSACESQIGREYKGGSLLILDRCNPDPQDRKYWLTLMMSNSHAVCLHFDYSVDLCLQRIDSRLGHPMIQAGRGGNAVKQMHQTMHTPKNTEGFGAVLTVTSHNAAREAILLLGGPVNITKFPRTTHLINLGASTPDDIVNDDWEDDLTGRLIIEEKIDGANMGFSLDFDKNILVQNRSHYVNSTSHAQFKPLKSWLERNSGTLLKLLNLDPMYPERFILYGEWVVAKHSILYSALPDYFMAFDFFDRKTKSFTSREYLERMLEGTGIKQVPLIMSTERIGRSELLDFMKRQSLYYNGPIEGVYVRFEDEKRTITKARGKVVRSNFISGNEHWAKGETQMNGLRLSD